MLDAFEADHGIERGIFERQPLIEIGKHIVSAFAVDVGANNLMAGLPELLRQ
jgi:hypothetical protein